MPKRLTQEEFIEKAIKVHNFKYNYSNIEYKNVETKIKIICSNHGEFYQTPHAHLSGQGCKTCGYIDNGLKRFNKLQGQKFNRLLVIRECGRTKTKRVIWECVCDCGEMAYVQSSMLINGNTQSCGCLQKERARQSLSKCIVHKGSNHHRWKHNLTNEERQQNRIRDYDSRVHEWRSYVYKRDKYTCQISGRVGGTIHAHHLESWNSNKELRFEVNNGITLSDKIHKLFHDLYGRGDNTRQQFDEFIQKYQRGELDHMIENDGKKVLLLGGAGYIGSSIFLFLSKLGYNVTVIDTEYFGNFSTFINYKKMYYYYLRKDYIEKFDSVILCAGHSSVKLCENDPSGAFFNNVVNFYYLLGKIKPEQQLIYMSSSSVYSGVDGDHITEDCRMYVPLNQYDLSKFSNDNYALISNITYFGLRLGTVCGGPTSNLRIDTMANSFYSSYKKNNSINVFNGHAKRPLLGMSDLCRAIHIILQKGTYENRGLYNLASFNTTVNDLAKQYSQILNCSINYDDKITPCYDFTMSTNKFSSVFDFKFEDTVESIIKSLENNWIGMKKGRRDKVPGA